MVGDLRLSFPSVLAWNGLFFRGCALQATGCRGLHLTGWTPSGGRVRYRFSSPWKCPPGRPTLSLWKGARETRESAGTLQASPKDCRRGEIHQPSVRTETSSKTPASRFGGDRIKPCFKVIPGVYEEKWRHQVATF